MKTSSLLHLLALGGLTRACGHDHHDDKVWTKEELADLEAKWGYEVRHVLPISSLLETQYSS